MAKQKVEKFFPVEEEIAMVGLINKEVKVAFSSEKSDYGFCVVRYELNDRLEGIKDTIKYKRIDLNEKDTKRNRVIFSNQDDADRAVIASYLDVFNYLKEKKNGNN